ncbi:MAG: 5'-methylthioadenosine/adenosylhomocysteine nucleosidase [Acidimicrobiia bacterium]|nr:5'-methylthioadenosine/adenosylhomocysteine nucleosidase [Acidimicrobiia bacterium]
MIGVLGAMDQEVALVTDLLDDRDDHTIGPRWAATGRIGGREVLVTTSGFGKVAAASTVTVMIERYGVAAVLFTGVAGGVGAGVEIGDVVVAHELAQHDFDASPIFPRFTIPTLGTDRIAADPAIADALAEGARAAGRAVHRGLVASGDRFVDDAAETAALRDALPGLLAVEMEGAAVAQVCTEIGVPFGVVRTISDHADADAAPDFLAFVEGVAAPLSAAIVAGALAALET